MPVIKIREETEQVVYPASGQSNAAVIPLFVSSVGIKDGYYYRADLKTTKFSKVATFEEAYNEFAIKDPKGVFTDKNYYMIKDLLSRGLEVLVKPVDLSSADDNMFPPVKHWDEEEGKYIIDEDNAVVLPLYSWVDPTFLSGYKRAIGSLSMSDDLAKYKYRTGEDIIGHESGETDLRPRFNYFDPKEGTVVDYHDFALTLQYLIIKGFYTELKDKTRFNFKFMTTGSYENVIADTSEIGYNTDEISTMINLCAALKEIDKNSGRGDAMVLVDFASEITKKDDKIYQAINILGDNLFLDNDVEKWKFADCTYPWVIKKAKTSVFDADTESVNISSEITPIEFTGSYAYLKAFADFLNADEANKSLDYMAIAGYARGSVGDSDDCTPIEDLGEIDMHLFQNDSFSAGYDDAPVLALTINPIIKCQDGMYRIWGNRIMLPLGKVNGEQVYADQVKDCNYFLNVRHLVCDIKKECYFASTRVSFEPNDDVTWFNFKSIVNPLLDNMVLNRGMEWYSWKRLPADSKGLMKAMLTIKPIEAVESFDITVFIRNTDEQ